MAVERNADARWEGDLKRGNGHVEFGKGAYSGSYSYASRWESGEGTSPEEMVAEAHASCFSMEFANTLAGEGHTPDNIRTTATVTLDGLDVTKIHLKTRGEVPGIDQAAFEKHAEDAKVNCPISKALASVPEITVDATLDS